MALIHITLRENWSKIQKHGYLEPKSNLAPNPTGGDVGDVAVFSVDPSDQEALRELRTAVTWSKNQNFFTRNKYTVEDFVLLQIDENCTDIAWRVCPGEKRELSLFGPMQPQVVARIGEYHKTAQSVPLSCITEISGF